MRIVSLKIVGGTKAPKARSERFAFLQFPIPQGPNSMFVRYIVAPQSGLPHFGSFPPQRSDIDDIGFDLD